MATHSQQNDIIANKSQTQPPRVIPVAAGSGVLMAVMLLLLQFPLLVSTGLWLLGLAVVLINYAIIASRRYDTPTWEIAIGGQISGLIGIAILFIASLIAA